MKGLSRIAVAGVAAIVGTAGLSACGAAASQKAAAAPLVVLPSPIGSYSRNFNPFSPTDLPGTTGLVYQDLFYFNPLKSQTYPMLGTSFAWSGHGTVLTVHLRKNVKWTNGQPFNADDVVYTFDLLKRYPALDTNGIWKVLSKVKAVNSDVVTFIFKAPNVPYQWYVLGETPIIDQALWKQVSDPVKYGNPNPVGTGPYLLKSFSPQVYSFSANASYWGGKPKVPTVEYPAYTSNSSADLALSRGKIDWAGLFIPNAQKVYVKPNPKQNHYWFPPNYIVILYTNLKNPLLAQLPVRQAISLAINREKIDKVGEYGYENPSSPTGLILPNNKAWLNPSLPPQDVSFSYNPAKAVSILKSAGYKKNAQGIFTSPSGQPLSFTLNVVSSATDWVSDASIMQSELHNVGIKLTVNQEQYGAFYGALKSGTYQLAIWGSSPGPTPYYLYNALLSPSSIGNYEHWNSSATNAALAQYSASSNLSVQKHAMYAIEHTMATQLPSIPLVNGPNWYEYNTSQYTGWPTPSNPYSNVTPASAFGTTVVLMHLHPVAK
ncbi:MAG: ABC transporter substrate-binding protein [Firmicutes bacterium]|jgi:peptide/nickel transport system substrate-binding protein|uniref:ABC transporter substrate-binding protein n=1 Tax=Sulfobacillus benefaciens TaxID=453960 RepID=A0A2T2X9V8_9FIRM|nr:ABC transporter substrate-binding protein [Bacillota bacterium]PSR31272.1 MAG: ABC transporter substrate-binding protein [Sulfobacillus benefaciens]